MLAHAFSGKVRAFVASVVVLGALASFGLGWKDTLNNQFANQRAMYQMSSWMNDHLPDATRIGVFNAGVQAYFSRAIVVNLDGLVNNEAFEAMRDKRLWAYVHEEELEYISDFSFYMTYRYKSFFGVPDIFTDLEVVRDESVEQNARGIENLTLYRITSSKEAR